MDQIPKTRGRTKFPKPVGGPSDSIFSQNRPCGALSKHPSAVAAPKGEKKRSDVDPAWPRLNLWLRHLALFRVISSPYFRKIGPAGLF